MNEKDALQEWLSWLEEGRGELYGYAPTTPGQPEGWSGQGDAAALVELD